MTITLEPWGDGDLDLLRALNAPEMTEHLGGPETDEKVVARNEKYVRRSAEGIGGINKVLVDGVIAGNVNYWADDSVYEIGWGVVPAFQGRGVATSAVLLALDELRRTDTFRYVHAYPRVSNLASNGVCRKAGFTLIGEVSIDYPPGVFALSNDWVFDLDA